MSSQYRCTNQRRRLEVGKAEHDPLNGIDYLEVLDKQAETIGSAQQRTLLVRCIRRLPAAISAANVEILGGVRVTGIGVEWAARADTLAGDPRLAAGEDAFFSAQPEPDKLLVVRTDSDGDHSTYRLCLVDGHAPLAGFDPPLSCVDFSFKVECPSDFDCKTAKVCPPEATSAPPLDYLAKDYQSFRRLMLDRMSAIMPSWRDRSAADLGVAVVEVLAYAADRLSYFQDAAATEAYLGTARRRPSIRRHARLLDYAMHEGCNARAWIAVEVETGVANVLLGPTFDGGSRRTRLLTRVPGRGTAIAESERAEVMGTARPQVFEPLFAVRLFDAHNCIRFYTWGDEECCLPKGATRATLRDDAGRRLRLRRGDVLVFEEVKGPATNQSADADPTRRHAVRLTRVAPEASVDQNGVRTAGALAKDTLFDQPIVEVEWDAADALPFPLCLSTTIEAPPGEWTSIDGVSVIRGNVLLADHGETVGNVQFAAPNLAITGEAFDPQPNGERPYRPRLERPDVTHAQPFDLQLWADAVAPTDPGWIAANAATAQDPRRALPVVGLRDKDQRGWSPRADLLASDRFDLHFVVEVDSDRRATLRFGDGVYGEIPEAVVEGEAKLTAGYRVGNGSAGNVGAGAIVHVVTTAGLGIVSVRNPLPATGGVDPESLEEVRQYAPQAFRRPERAVTEKDYQDAAERHPQVSKAVARRRWTGSWHTVFVTVDRVGGRPVDRAFEDELTAWLGRFKLAGHDVEIEPPRLVPLDILLHVCVDPGYRRGDVKQALLATFASVDLPDGRRGYFHPDNFTFGQPVYLSRIIATAMAVDGVRWVSMDPLAVPPARFQRWGKKPNGELARGYVAIGRFEIAQLDNDPNAPENGKIEFCMEGGL